MFVHTSVVTTEDVKERKRRDTDGFKSLKSPMQEGLNRFDLHLLLY